MNSSQNNERMSVMRSAVEFVGRVLCAIAVCGLMSGELFGAPFAEWIEAKSPKGAVVRIWGQGDEYSARFEAADGHAVVYDSKIGAYAYARKDTASGALVTTDIAVGDETPADMAVLAGIPLHERDVSDAFSVKRKQRIDADESNAETRQRWEELKTLQRQSRRYKRAIDKGEEMPLKAPPSSPTLGKIVGVTLLIDFPTASDGSGSLAQEVHPDVTKADLEQLVNGENFSKWGNASSVRKYYEDVSGGNLVYTNIVLGWFKAAHPRSYYDDSTQDSGPSARQLIGEILEQIANSSEYASRYLPLLQQTSYSGSYFKALNVFFAGQKSPVWNKGLWAHKWTLGSAYYSKLAVKIGTATKYFNTYQISPVTKSPSIGTFCHENGHMICGFPDLYSYEDGGGNGVGSFCLMCSHGSGNPQYVCAYLRAAAGWVTPREMPTGDNVLSVSSRLDDVWSYSNPLDDSQYFLVENRQRKGRDSYLPGGGVLIWRCDENGDNTSSSPLSGFSGMARYRRNYELSLEQADGLYELEQEINYGQATDCWYQGNPQGGLVFSDTTEPCAKWKDGTSSGLVISDFSANDDVMTFHVGAVATMSYAIGYSLGGGTSGSSHPSEAMIGEAFCVSAPTRSGYTFAGWTVTSGLDASTAKWGTNFSPSTAISSSSTKCVNGATGDVYFKNLTSTVNGSVTLTANWTAVISLPTALDNTALTFTTGGDAGWFGQSVTKHDGTDAAQSGPITDSQSSWLQTTVTGPGTISFWWYASSEGGNYDYLAFSVDGVQTGKIGGTSCSWTQCSYALDAGSHVLKWTYRKDESVSIGLDAGFVDQVVWASTAPKTFYVSVNGSDSQLGTFVSEALATIQRAVNLARDGDEIVVLDGSYEPIETSNKAITIRSANGATKTFIDGALQWSRGLTNRCARLGTSSSCTNTLLTGFTLTNGRGYGGGGVAYGRLRDCRIVDNVATNGGGAYYSILENCEVSGNVAMTSGGGAYYGKQSNCTFDANLARWGGGAYGGTQLRCRFSENQAETYGGGSNSGDLRDCTFVRNVAAHGGGGTCNGVQSGCEYLDNQAQNGGGAYNGTQSNCLFDGNEAEQGGGSYRGTNSVCRFVDNHAKWGGGLIYGRSERCLLAENHADNSGGGAYDGNLSNCLVVDNVAKWGGGSYTGRLSNCTLSRNEATTYGGGASNGNLFNCIVWDNSSSSGRDVYSSTCTYTCSGQSLTGEGNISANPLFVDAVGDDFRIAVTSPCRNAGSNAYAAGSVDYDGNPRIVGGVVDMGACECQTAATTRPVNDNFTNATAISGVSGSLTASSANATKENGEPYHGTVSATNSVWWKCTASVAGSMTITTEGSGFDTGLGVYTGSSVSALTKVASNDDVGSGLRWSSVTFPVVAGTTYYIAVAGYKGATGSVKLNWSLLPPAAPTGLSASGGNSSTSVSVGWTAVSGATSYEIWRGTSSEFTSAVRIGTSSAAGYADTTATMGRLYYYWVKAVNAAGTSELPTPVTGWRKFSDSTSNVPFTTGGNAEWVVTNDSTFAGAVSLRSGKISNSQSTWLETQVAGPSKVSFYWKPSSEANYDKLTLSLDGSQAKTISGVSNNWTYAWIDVSSGTHALRWTYAKDRSVSSGSDCGWVDSVNGIPISGSAPSSVTASQGTSSTAVTVAWSSVANATAYRVYRGTTSAASEATQLSTVTARSYVDSSAEAGVTYYYWVRSVFGAGYTSESAFGNPVTGYLKRIERPANDDFANATAISGSSGTAVATNAHATYEPGEPLKEYCSYATNTVWWTWVAPSNGMMQVDTIGSSFDTALGVYSGSSLSTLSVLSQDDDSGANYRSACNFECIAGKRYYICVASGYKTSGSITMNWKYVPLPEPFSRASEGCYGLFVGINRYALSGCQELPCCIKDIEAMRGAGIRYGEWRDANCRELPNEFATKARVRALLASLAEVARPGETVLFYQSSHGGESGSTLDVYLCMHDAKYWDYELAEDLAKFRSGVKLLIVVDACHSGGLFKEDCAKSGSFDLADRVSKLMRSGGVVRSKGSSGISPEEIGWITAADYDQTSRGGSSGSEFTMAMVDAWQDDGESADLDGNHRLDFHELFMAAEQVGSKHGAIGQCANEHVVKSVTARLYPGFVPPVIIGRTGEADIEIPAAWFTTGKIDGRACFNPSTFVARFGKDYAAAAKMPTGKVDAHGNPMYVWQDFITGTDPTDKTSEFKVSIGFVDGKPVVTWSPDLNEGGAKALRTYRTLGINDLSQSADPASWREVSPGSESAYRFFKVEVDMR